ncbi:amino acid permease [Pseudoclavibacter sp. CFCC 11306]|uniref:amino acid permease n=1 Tax=Pseudoclavibacter sp. CFCC 11306 TaxID=1564493 RepID=UPI001300EA3B|nr:amino acid permease [Pseudoclavibacter sp. CFCC 11306]KAB1657453.1 amino acid permease [Pseudoclavibacter sp. CFCC 11306]
MTQQHSKPDGLSPDTGIVTTAASEENIFIEEEAGFHKSLGARQLQMIAIGGAIGTGLFLGAGGRLAQAGPSLLIIYAFCGVFAYLILRALGELVVHRPSSGSFVSYAREFFGEKAAFVSGWMYWVNWATTSIVDVTAIAIYVKWFGQYSAFIQSIPQWTIALLALVIVVGMNLISVKVFGEMEFWFALIKVGALVIFLVLGVIFVIFGTPTGDPRGFTLIFDNGGMFPNGILPALVIMQGVVFAYAGIELVGTTSGETKDARKVIPKAINTVIVRIAVFYVGSVLLLVLLLPYTAYSAGESPFVTFFSHIGIDAAAPIMELVVLTAALSSLNAGMYSTGRILHSMSMAGSAPKFAQKISPQGVPYGGILLTAIVTLMGVVLNMFVPEQAFEIVLNLASIGIISGWATITLAHLRYYQLAKQGLYRRPKFRMPGAPYTNYATLAFLLLVIVLIGLDYPTGTYTLASMLIVIPLLVIGWYACRSEVKRIATERIGFTGAFPVVASRPMADELAEAEGGEAPEVTIAREVHEANIASGNPNPLDSDNDGDKH